MKDEHCLQMMSPHNLQWCLRRRTPKLLWHFMQRFSSLSCFQGTTLRSKSGRGEREEKHKPKPLLCYELNFLWSTCLHTQDGILLMETLCLPPTSVVDHTMPHPWLYFPAQYANSRNECEAGWLLEKSIKDDAHLWWISSKEVGMHHFLSGSHSPTRWQQSVKVKDKRSFLSVMVPFSCLRLLGVSSLSIRKSCERKQQHVINKVINKPVTRLLSRVSLSVPLPSPIWWQGD